MYIPANPAPITMTSKSIFMPAFYLLSPARGRGWERGLRTAIAPPLLTSPPRGGEEYDARMPDALPALTLIAMPGRRRQMIDLCRDAERRGFTGIYVPSPMGNMSMCEALSWQTGTIPFATSIVPIYMRTMIDFCQSAAMMHEVSGGRFSLGIGIAHGPSYVRMGVTPGKPLADTRAFIEKF